MLTVALIGPDGCGKTTVAHRLEESMPWPVKYVYMGVSLESSNVMLPTSRLKLFIKRLLKRPSDTTGPRDKTISSDRPKGLLRRAMWVSKQCLRLTNQVAEEGFRQLLVRWHRLRGRVVILDRDFFSDYYAYDIVPDESRSVFRRIHGWLLQNAYKKPDIVIFLDVSGETMFARKREGSVEVLNRRRADYRQLQTVVPGFVTIDAEQPLTNVLNSVKKVIGNALDQRTDRDFSADRPVAVLVGMDTVSGLQAARCLHRRGITVIGLAKNLNHYCCRTRVCRRILPSELSGDALVNTLTDMGPYFSRKAILCPCTDRAVLTISEHRTVLEPWFSFALPEDSLVRMFTDKAAFSEFARDQGVPIPRTRVLRSEQDALSAGQELTYPCYIKPAVKTIGWESKTKAKVIIASSGAELAETYRSCAGWAESLLVQEEISGPVTNHFTCDMYYDRSGNLAASFTSRKLRQWPPKTGTGCLSVESNSTVVQTLAQRVFSAVRFHGFAYVEFKRDDRTGRLRVVETNVGRPTGRSCAAVASGIDLAYIMYCDLAELPIPAFQQSPAIGRKWIHGRRDFLSAITHWREGSLSLAKWIKTLSRIKSKAVFSWGDLGPWMAECRRYSWMAVCRLFRVG